MNDQCRPRSLPTAPLWRKVGCPVRASACSINTAGARLRKSRPARCPLTCVIAGSICNVTSCSLGQVLAIRVAIRVSAHRLAQEPRSRRIVAWVTLTPRREGESQRISQVQDQMRGRRQMSLTAGPALRSARTTYCPDARSSILTESSRAKCAWSPIRLILVDPSAATS